MNCYPINLKIENKKCFVVGGGKVAYRKILELLDAGANILIAIPVTYSTHPSRIISKILFLDVNLWQAFKKAVFLYRATS